MQTRGNDEVARAFGRGLDQQGSFDLKKLMPTEIVARKLGHARTRLQNLLHARTTQIDVAILESRLFVGALGFVGKNRRRLGGVEQLEFFGDDFNLTRGQFGIGSTRANAHRSFDRDDIFTAQGLRQRHHFFGGLLEVEDHLAQAFTIAKVSEDEATALIAVGVDPTSEDDGLSNMACTKRATHVCALKHKRSRIVTAMHQRLATRREMNTPLRPHQKMLAQCARSSSVVRTRH